MHAWTRLGLPVGLGLMAAAVNWVNVTSKITPESYVVIEHEVAKGKPFEKASFAKIDLPRGLGRLSKTIIRWEDRALLYGQAAPRNFKKGDVVFVQDREPQVKKLSFERGETAFWVSLDGISNVNELIRPGQFVGFTLAPAQSKTASNPGRREEIGPFYVLSVGEDIDPVNELDDRHHRRNGQVMTLLGKRGSDGKGLDAKCLRLQSAANRIGPEKVVGISLVSPQESDAAEDEPQEAPESIEPLTVKTEAN